MSDIKVLWLDDQAEEMLSNEDWRAQFEDEGIVLHAEKYAEAVIERLKEAPEVWDLVLLDAIGYKKEGTGLNKAGLAYAVPHIQKIATSNNVSLPIFIYTGQDSLFDDEEFVDSYSDIPIYRKGWEGTELLIKDIKKLLSTRKDRVIIDMYPKVFDAINFLELNKSKHKILGFLKEIHYKEQRFHPTPIKDLRIILEEIFHSLIRPEIGLVPAECYKNDKSGLNMHDIILYTSGERTKSEYGKAPAYGGSGVIDLEGPIYPPLMSTIINTLYIYTSANDSHITIVRENDKPDLLESQCVQYAGKVDGSYLNYSFTYQICDILTYTAAYVKKHSDIEQNRNRVYQIRNDVTAGKTIQTSDGIMHFGQHCWVDPSDFNDGDSLNLKKIRLERVPKGSYKYKIVKK